MEMKQEFLTENFIAVLVFDNNRMNSNDNHAANLIHHKDEPGHPCKHQ